MTSFFIPYISPAHTKEDIIDIIENTIQIGKISNIDIVLSRKGKYMAFVHMESILSSDNTTKILSIIREQGQYYLYDIKKRMKLVLKNVKPDRINMEMEDLNRRINQKFAGLYTEIENIKHIIYDIQRKLYGYPMTSTRIGNVNTDNWT
jgi:dihydroxyacetone kinase-like predicted kinase